MVPVNGVNVTVAYPGFAEARMATLAALSTLPTQPKIMAPETSDLSGVARARSARTRAVTPDACAFGGPIWELRARSARCRTPSLEWALALPQRTPLHATVPV
jgi:hypothetical protein